MDANELTEGLSVGAQITPADVAELARMGFRSILSNRPDGEEAGQPRFAEIEEAARAHGMEARHLPVTSPVTDEDAAAFGAALADLPAPVYAHCRSGTRSASLWALSRAGEMATSEILARAEAAGYDLSGLEGRLEDRTA